jgi:signal transduction histidine kinase
MYAPLVQILDRKTPTPGLLLGLIVIVAVVIAYSWYTTVQISSLQELQSEMVDRNRKDSLQLLRIQDDLNSLAHAMRDMLDGGEPYPVTAWAPQFERIRADLEDALRIQEELAVVHRTPSERHAVASSMAQFWDAVDRMFAMARSGKETAARAQIQLSLQARQAALSTSFARLLVQNNENEEQAAQRIGEVYNRVQRQLYLFLVATLTGILLTGLYLVRSNRRIFAELSSLSEQRSELAQALIATQESTLRNISRELHDEFGQVLTAIGSLLKHAKHHAPEDSGIRRDLQEACEIAQSTLDNVRGMSQALHPRVLDEANLENTLDWFLPTFERHSGVRISYEKMGTPFALNERSRIHVYRIVQEALNNVTRHSGVDRAWVRLRFLNDALELDVEDHGKGFSPGTAKRGIGLIAMRERAEILGGTAESLRPREGGTLVRLRIPKEGAELHAG